MTKLVNIRVIVLDRHVSGLDAEDFIIPRIWKSGTLDDLVEDTRCSFAKELCEKFPHATQRRIDMSVMAHPVGVFDNESVGASEWSDISHTIATIAALRDEIRAISSQINTLRITTPVDAEQLSTLQTAKANLEQLLVELSRKHLVRN